jgi:hypothetical protein
MSVEYRVGEARLTVGRQTFDLRELTSDNFSAAFEAACPARAQAEWIDASKSWSVLLIVSRGDVAAGGWTTSSLEFNHLAVEPPLTSPGTNCDIRVLEASERGFRGELACRGLRWLNAYDAAVDPTAAQPVDGLPPFNANVDFQARP